MASAMLMRVEAGAGISGTGAGGVSVLAGPSHRPASSDLDQ
jgi:hypothetical protein